MVPIKGSIKGADFKIMRQAAEGHRDAAEGGLDGHDARLQPEAPVVQEVWIDQDEANAQPADGTKLRFILSQTFDPQVEITDDFVRVTIRRPEPSDDAAPEKHGDRAEKHGSDRAEKRTEPPPSDEPAAPSEEKSGD